MFVVSPIVRRHQPDTGDFISTYPVVFEDPELGIVTSAVASSDTREAAQKVADALNAALNTDAPKAAQKATTQKKA